MVILEREYSCKLSDSAKDVKNPVIRVVMEAVAQDSLKHSMIYEAMLELPSKEPHSLLRRR